MMAWTGTGQTHAPWPAEREHPIQRPFSLELPLAILIVAAILLGFVITNLRMWHWFVLPVALCGLLVGVDAVRWMRGRYDLYDPKGLIGVFGLFFFVLVPLLFVQMDVDIEAFEDPPDWRPWVGLHSLLNAGGLVLYQLAQRAGFAVRLPRRRARWTIDLRQAWPWFVLFGGVALFGQGYYFYSAGGISGIIAQAARVRETGQFELSGDGLFQLAGNSLPVLITITLTLATAGRRAARPASLKTTLGLLLGLFVMQFLLGGFTGSRSATVWAVFWLVGIVHRFWRRISMRMTALGVAFIVLFMYLYGFYKSGGMEALNQVAAGQSLETVEEETGRSFDGMLIGDFGRVDVQSYTLYRLLTVDYYRLRMGYTYLDAFARRIPSWIWHNRPRDAAKTIAGTDLFYGLDRYEPANRWTNSSKVWGLAGEAMLNFGPWAAPAPFAVLGFLVGFYRRVLARWHPTDARRFIAPLLTLLLISALFSDLDNLVAILIDKVLILSFTVVAAQRRMEQVSR